MLGAVLGLHELVEALADFLGLGSDRREQLLVGLGDVFEPERVLVGVYSKYAYW